ncbi:MAG: conserved hypothetical protein [Marine Group I thaumarchaeote]|nr:MAG: hypothetical protein NPMRIOTA_10026 [Nitrosopumilales archaeon]GFN39464.1 MAG: conserved hypothetical protein [Marine Group I thaumarchaeote]
MKICSICHKISATNDDHLDCKEKRRIELEAEDLKETLNEKLTISGLDGDLQKEIKSILDHMMKEKKSPS